MYAFRATEKQAVIHVKGLHVLLTPYFLLLQVNVNASRDSLRTQLETVFKNNLALHLLYIRLDQDNVNAQRD